MSEIDPTEELEKRKAKKAKARAYVREYNRKKKIELNVWKERWKPVQPEITVEFWVDPTEK